MIQCNNCSAKLKKNNIVEQELLETFYHDLDNDEQYTEKEHIPSNHNNITYSEMIKFIYECPLCNTRTEVEEIKEIK